MDVSIIIVNYNTKDITSNCIDSVFEQTKDIEFEVILVDNASKDGSIETFGKDKRIKFIEAGDNLGFGKANNLGLKYATGKYIFFLNSDTILLNNAVKIFKDFYDAYHEDLHLGGIGCQLIDKEGNLIHSGNYFPNWKDDFKAEMRDHWSHLRHQPKKTRKSVPLLKSPFAPFKIDYVTGADLFVSREILDKYGAFDPDFFMYYEETEMQNRWQRVGLCNYIVDNPKIMHLEGASATHLSINTNRELRVLRSILIFYRKVLNKLDYIFFRITFFFQKMLHVISMRTSFKDKKRYFKLLISK